MRDPRRIRARAYDVPGERRHAIVGLTERGRLLWVCYTFRGQGRDQRVRVVTARPAHHSERDAYNAR